MNQPQENRRGAFAARRYQNAIRLGALLAALALGAGGASAAESSKALSGHVPRQIRAATKLKRIPAGEKVELSLAVRLDQALLDQTLAQIYGPKAPARKRFLSPAEFARKFDLAEKRRQLKAFAEAAGLSVNAAEDRPNSLVVKVAGPASLVEKAFAVELNRYRGADGQVFRANETDPRVPASLIPHLNAVLGLSDIRGVRKPHFRRARPVPTRPAATAGAAPGSAGSALSLTGNGPYGFLAPADIKTIYGLSGTLTGSGQTLALFELAGYIPADITTYESFFGISPVTVTPVLVDGAVNTCVDADGCAEVTLDIELAAALAPGLSRMLVYEGPNTDQGLIDTYARIANDDSAQVVSVSWGSAEQSGADSVMTTENTIFQQMAAQGQTVYAASGDSGAYDDQTHPAVIVTDDPASQPYVTGVGGTSLSGTLASHTETVWNNGCTSGVSCAGGGGGIANFVSGSLYWPLPSYQSGVAGTYSQLYRNVPDVALNADPAAAPYSIYYTGDSSGWTGYGGTSCAAPLWAALTTLINQQSSASGNAPLGFANPTLYHLATSASYGSYFIDVTSGGNGEPGGRYRAGTGYDNATGWGSFKADALITAIAGAPPTNPAIAAVYVSSLTMSFGPVGADGYIVTASTASDFTGTLYSSATLNQASALSPQGLSANTTYYLRAGALWSGTTYFATATPSASTLAVPPSLPSAPLSARSTDGFTFSFNGNNPAGTRYLVQVSVSPTFSAVAASMQTTATAVAVAGLQSNQYYYAEVAALNNADAPTSFAVTAVGTATLVAAPVAASVPFPSAAVGSGRMTLQWSPGTLASGTPYLAQISSSPSFAFISASSNTANAWAAFTSGIQPNTTYYGQVKAMGNWGQPASAWLSPAGTGSSLALPPTDAAFTSVLYTSATASWTPAPASPSSMTCEGYRLDFSPSPDFSSGVISSVTAAGASSAIVTGLNGGTVYYIRLGALNWTGAANEVALGSASTSGAPMATGTMTASGLELTLPHPFPLAPKVSGVHLMISPSAFPLGTAVMISGDVAAAGWPGLSEAQSGEGTISPLAAHSTLEIHAGADADASLEPSAPVTLVFSYDAQLAAGRSEASLHLFSYAPTTSRWALVPSQADASAHVLTATLPHFSYYAPFFVAASTGAGLSSIRVWPQPWEIGGGGPYGASALQFANLGAGTRVRILTVTGELVKEGTSTDGTFAWDGGSRFGRKAAAGTYLAVFEANGQKQVRRVVIIR